jgi:hypothetical protein
MPRWFCELFFLGRSIAYTVSHTLVRADVPSTAGRPGAVEQIEVKERRRRTGIQRRAARLQAEVERRGIGKHRGGAIELQIMAKIRCRTVQDKWRAVIHANVIAHLHVCASGSDARILIAIGEIVKHKYLVVVLLWLLLRG